MRQALELALEALEEIHVGNMTPMAEINWNKAITAIKEALAQTEQERNLKLMPREATPEMLKAMDECSMEGYDERLYAGHAGSVYMAAWDAFYGQHCYCGDITNLGVIHRDDGPCHYPDHKEPEQEPVAWATREDFYRELDRSVERIRKEMEIKSVTMRCKDYDLALPIIDTHFGRVLVGQVSTPPQRTWVGLTPDDFRQLEKETTVNGYNGDYCPTWDLIEAVEEKLKEKNT